MFLAYYNVAMNDEQPTKLSLKTRIVFCIAVVVLVVIVASYVLLREQEITENSDQEIAGATTTINVGGITFELSPGASVEVLPAENRPSTPAPDMNRQLSFPESFSSPEAKVNISMKIAEARKNIAENPYDYDSWIGLGIYWKMIEDYEGARLAWEYASLILPENPMAYSNLGFLYGYHIKNQNKAKENFEKALSFAGSQAFYYGQAFEYYRDVLDDKETAREVAEKGKVATGDIESFNKLIETLK